MWDFEQAQRVIRDVPALAVLADEWLEGPCLPPGGALRAIASEVPWQAGFVAVTSDRPSYGLARLESYLALLLPIGKG